MKPKKLRRLVKKYQQLGLEGLRETEYFCSKCGIKVDKNDSECPGCNEQFEVSEKGRG